MLNIIGKCCLDKNHVKYLYKFVYIYIIEEQVVESQSPARNMMVEVHQGWAIARRVYLASLAGVVSI